MPAPLDHARLRQAVDVLAAADADLGGIVDRHGAPPLWAREPGFETVVRIILEQQVSLASADAAMRRLVAALGADGEPGLGTNKARAASAATAAAATESVSAATSAKASAATASATLSVAAVAASPEIRIEPAAVAHIGEERLRQAGLTRQKARYVVALARDVEAGRVDLAALATKDDDGARAQLTSIVGIGRWSADIYLLMALGRPDVWPIGDLALAGSMRRAKGLATLPDNDRQLAIAEAWRPWRAVAARILWHAYLQGER